MQKQNSYAIHLLQFRRTHPLVYTKCFSTPIFLHILPKTSMGIYRSVLRNAPQITQNRSHKAITANSN